MNTSHVLYLPLLLTAFTLEARPVVAQGTMADYERAFGLEERFDGLVVDAPEVPVWIGSNRLWYRKSVRAL